MIRDEYYARVPKDRAGNIAFRRKMLKAGAGDPAVADALRKASARSLLFFVNTFVWTHDPRLRVSSLPFVTWDYQDDALPRIEKSIDEGGELSILKTRDMGASWMVLVAYYHRWNFRSNTSFLCLSRKEDLVDKPGSPASLFWKLDFIHSRLPGWMRSKLTRTSMRFQNDSNGSVIEGESTNENCARAGRYSSILWDEVSSTGNTGHAILSSMSQSANSRIYVSTPQGCGNAFYDLCHNPHIPRLDLHWTLHPGKSAGLYRDTAGNPRSPWYDQQCKVLSPMTVAQEIDMNFAGSDSQFFEPEVLQKIAAHVREPFATGLVLDDEAGHEHGFQHRQNGPLKLWTTINEDGKPPSDAKYAVGADIAMGTGASNSTATVVHCGSGEKVAELVSPTMRPDDFADAVVALCRWFHGAYLIWEATGPGRAFGDRVVKLRYWNIYYHRDERKLNKKPTDVPGWFSSTERKLSLLSDLRTALHTEAFIQRSGDALSEARMYVYTPSGIANGRAVYQRDPSGAKANHGDRVMADALALRGMREIVREPVAPKQPEVAFGSFQWRRQNYRRRSKMRLAW